MINRFFKDESRSNRHRVWLDCGSYQRSHYHGSDGYRDKAQHEVYQYFYSSELERVSKSAL